MLELHVFISLSEKRASRLPMNPEFQPDHRPPLSYRAYCALRRSSVYWIMPRDADIIGLSRVEYALREWLDAADWRDAFLWFNQQTGILIDPAAVGLLANWIRATELQDSSTSREAVRYMQWHLAILMHMVQEPMPRGQ